MERKTNMEDCVFCDAFFSKEQVVYEDDNFFGRFDRFPVTPGHLELIPKRHVKSFFDLNNEELKAVGASMKEIPRVIENTDFEKLYRDFLANPINEQSSYFCNMMLAHPGINAVPGGYNIGINDGRVAGRTVDHLHIHFIPRYFGDVENPIGGIRNMFPGMGNYKS